jgi:hypothetical protein
MSKHAPTILDACLDAKLFAKAFVAASAPRSP